MEAMDRTSVTTCEVPPPPLLDLWCLMSTHTKTHAHMCTNTDTHICTNTYNSHIQCSHPFDIYSSYISPQSADGSVYSPPTMHQCGVVAARHLRQCGTAPPHLPL